MATAYPAPITFAEALWPARGASRPLRLVLLALLGSAILTISAKFEVPFYPVPMTLQTLVTVLLGIQTAEIVYRVTAPSRRGALLERTTDPDRYVSTTLRESRERLGNGLYQEVVAALEPLVAQPEALAPEQRFEINLLLAKGAEIDAENEEGVTALMLAAVEGRVAAVKTLVDHGADPDITNEDGDTAMKDAKEWDHEEVIQILKNARKARKGKK